MSYPLKVPSSHALRRILFRGIGQARSVGLTGQKALMDAALAELRAWAIDLDYPLDYVRAGAALVSLAGGLKSPFWDEPLPPRDELPETLAELVRYAIRIYGIATMWSSNRKLMAPEPDTYWKAVVQDLRNEGGPDPRPFWLADAIEEAAGPMADST